MPALKACLKPKFFKLSQKITVPFWPQNLKTISIISETIFFGRTLSTNENLILWFFGSMLANKNLPAVLVYFSKISFPLESFVLNLEIILECTLIALLSRACSISLMSGK